MPDPLRSPRTTPSILDRHEAEYAEAVAEDDMQGRGPEMTAVVCNNAIVRELAHELRRDGKMVKALRLAGYIITNQPRVQLWDESAIKQVEDVPNRTATRRNAPQRDAAL